MKLTDIQYETLKVMVESRAKIDEDKGITIKLEDIKKYIELGFGFKFIKDLFIRFKIKFFYSKFSLKKTFFVSNYSTKSRIVVDSNNCFKLFLIPLN